VLAFIIIIIVGLVIDLGGAPNHDRLGFRYWRGELNFSLRRHRRRLIFASFTDSPWVQYNGIEGALGRFASVVAAFVGAAFTYLGTETMVNSARLLFSLIAS